MGKRESKRAKLSKRKSHSKGLWTLESLQEERNGIEEDSGLGDSVPFADEEACHSAIQSLSRNGASTQFSVIPKNEKLHIYQESKRPRLDLPEEANELPEEKYSNGGQILPHLLSFKNVPALLSPLKNIQDHGLEVRNTPSFTLQPLSIQRIVPAQPPMTIVKEEKLAKKSNRHFLDKIYPAKSLDGTVELQLSVQPEEQHRARYQTEGSRGAVKDRSGLGHPIIKLEGYNKPAVLVTYLAWDGGSVAPHMFYQAYKVSGKNSTPCKEEKMQSTTLLHMDLLPEKGMTVSCDCVGLLKVRNVDVEQREQRQKSPLHRGRRKSTKCRLVFRTTIKMDCGAEETLQIVSEAICCTQPTGVPEICRKSLSFCSHEGGPELFIIGKNFFKDTKVIFQDKDVEEEVNPWKVTVTPDKDFLHQTHLICAVPPYGDITQKEVEVQIVVTSSGKSSEAHPFKFSSSFTDERSNLGPSVESQNLMPLPSAPINKDKMVVAIEPTISFPQMKPSGTSREQAIVHPLSIQRPFSYAPHRGLQGDNSRPSKVCEVKNTTTTATVFAPLATTLNIQQQHDNYTNSFRLPTTGGEHLPENSTTQNNESNEVIIENLVGMLKLARNTAIPSAQPAFVQMIADEILNQLKKNKISTASNTSQKKPVKEEVLLPEPTPTVNLPHIIHRQNVKSEKYSVAEAQNLFSQTQTLAQMQQYVHPPIKQNSVHTGGFPHFSSVETVMIPSSTAANILEVKPPNYVINTQNTMPLLNIDLCNSKNSTDNNQSSIGMNAEYIQTSDINIPSKKINLRPVTVSRQTLATSQQNFVNKDDNINNQNNYDTINPVYLQGQPKLEQSNPTVLQTLNLSPMLPVSRVQSQLYPSVVNLAGTTQSVNVVGTTQAPCLETPVETSNSNMSILNAALFDNRTEMQTNQVNLPLHTINQSSLTSELNVAENILRTDPITTNDNNSITDPILSQSTSRADMYTTQQGLQIAANGVNAQIVTTNSINSTISSEVTKRLEHLSETELINYINPTCFDNV